ncbi:MULTISPECIES: hypothetical protein [Serratia]|uniref:Uncharacterized protein n=1 Tax=Serratia fonticola TaxID=47917 RepID=A0AAJ1YG10_SERFO|nr:MULTISPECIES: hypothetical protein [Serratia]MDQ7210720.1 hypothetical protein [Serratia fonticola]MDQ9127595.1 hypothetical protein [Serratia fonticola]HBE9080693.1 hypothetical protein [Serratia fonticola]HBE9090467.1 hypothetical protein [Serratia fonticola]HBE9153233.1 hypothetical protein [Serratia fonticola]
MLSSSMAGHTAELTERYLDHPVTEPLSMDILTGDLQAAKSRQYHDDRAAKLGLWQ